MPLPCFDTPNIRKPGVSKEISGIKWVNKLKTFRQDFLIFFQGYIYLKVRKNGNPKEKMITQKAQLK